MFPKSYCSYLWKEGLMVTTKATEACYTYLIQK